MEDAIKELLRDRVPIFRGGQRPGLSLARLPGAIVKMFDALVHDGIVAECMQLTSNNSGVRRMALYKIVRMFNSIVDRHDVVGISGYKAKRMIELLALAGYGSLCGLKLQQSDFRVTNGVYPIPDGSRSMLVSIFPAATSDYLVRQGLRLMQKYRCRDLDVCTISAMLCFFSEQQDGKIQYV